MKRIKRFWRSYRAKREQEHLEYLIRSGIHGIIVMPDCDIQIDIEEFVPSGPPTCQK